MPSQLTASNWSNIPVSDGGETLGPPKKTMRWEIIRTSSPHKLFRQRRRWLLRSSFRRNALIESASIISRFSCWQVKSVDFPTAELGITRKGTGRGEEREGAGHTHTRRSDIKRRRRWDPLQLCPSSPTIARMINKWLDAAEYAPLLWWRQRRNGRGILLSAYDVLLSTSNGIVGFIHPIPIYIYIYIINVLYTYEIYLLCAYTFLRTALPVYNYARRRV